MDLKAFIEEFQDHLAPKLDTYEQAIYLYVFRHSRFEGTSDIVIGFKSARTRMAFGIGQKGSAMSENQCREKIRSLQSKGCLQVLGVERAGTRVRVNLPCEIPGIVVHADAAKVAPLEEIDFFSDPNFRELILKREGSRCFYCLRSLDRGTYVIEHVTSRPNGDNSYRNLVAACITCNNRKGALPAGDFIRTLYREAYLSANDFEDRLAQLERLTAGELKPDVALLREHAELRASAAIDQSVESRANQGMQPVRKETPG